MFSRNNGPEQGAELPQDWKDQTKEVLEEHFSTFCQKQQRYFEAFGAVYSEEIGIAVSLLHEVEINLSPITVYLSRTLEQNEAPKKTLNEMVDLVGLIFEEIASQENWNDFHDQWLKTEYRKRDYFYRVTRENIRLTIEADHILKDREQ